MDFVSGLSRSPKGHNAIWVIVDSVRDLNKKSITQKKKNQVHFRAPLFLGKWCGANTYFFILKNKKKKYMTELFFSLIE